MGAANRAQRVGEHVATVTTVCKQLKLHLTTSQDPKVSHRKTLRAAPQKVHPEKENCSSSTGRHTQEGEDP